MAVIIPQCSTQIAKAMVTSAAAPFQPIMAASMQSRQLGTALRQTKAPKKYGHHPVSIVAQVQQENVLNTRQQQHHLERCLEAKDQGAVELASSGAGRHCGEGASGLTRVAYQGNPGSYGHAVVAEAYQAEQVEAVPCREMEGVFKALETWVVDAALIPIQNSLDGSIHRNYDLLLRHPLLHIVGEVAWHVNHCLLAHPNASISSLRRVIGHPQALSHCSETLAALGLQAEDQADTAQSALLVASTPDTALVASSQAARVFGLQVIRHGIQDDSHMNITRFLQLARRRRPLPPPCPQAGPCKTTIAFTLRNGPPDLCKAMSAFALRDVTVTNLESRPAAPALITSHEVEAVQTAGVLGSAAAERNNFKYMFVVDIEASIASTRTQRALRQVEELSSFYRILGSYALRPLVQH